MHKIIVGDLNPDIVRPSGECKLTTSWLVNDLKFDSWSSSYASIGSIIVHRSSQGLGGLWLYRGVNPGLALKQPAWYWRVSASTDTVDSYSLLRTPDRGFILDILDALGEGPRGRGQERGID